MLFSSVQWAYKAGLANHFSGPMMRLEMDTWPHHSQEDSVKLLLGAWDRGGCPFLPGLNLEIFESPLQLSYFLEGRVYLRRGSTRRETGSRDREGKNWISDVIVWAPATLLNIFFYETCSSEDWCIIPQFSGLKQWQNVFCSHIYHLGRA